MMIEKFVKAQIAFSEKTFGPGQRLVGVTEHIERECGEVRKSGGLDIAEWCDIAILAIDGAWRSGNSAAAISRALEERLETSGHSSGDMSLEEKLLGVEHSCAASRGANGQRLWYWARIIGLAFAGANAAGCGAVDFEKALWSKLKTNKARTWPDWRTAGPGPIEHVREPAE